MTRHTDTNVRNPNCRKISEKKLNKSANIEMYAYSETTLGGPTVRIGTPFPQPPLPHYNMSIVVGGGVVLKRGCQCYKLCDDRKLNLCVLPFLTRCE